MAEDYVWGYGRFCDSFPEKNEAGRPEHETYFGRGQGVGGREMGCGAGALLPDIFSVSLYLPPQDSSLKEAFTRYTC